MLDPIDKNPSLTENTEETVEKAYEEKNKREIIDSEIKIFKEIVVEKFNEAKAQEINSALKLMIELHVDQKDRPDGKPYIVHPLEIANDIVEKYGVVESNIVVAALLHDAVEDQGLKLVVRRLLREDTHLSKQKALIDLKNLEEAHSSEIEEIALREIGYLYGKKVQSIVSGLSNPDFDSLIEKLKTDGIEKTKNDLYKEHVAEVVQNSDICVIKFTDFAKNALALGNLPEGEKKKKLKKKYGPVITEVFIPLFAFITENHPLYSKKDEITKRLEKTYAEQYQD